MKTHTLLDKRCVGVLKKQDSEICKLLIKPLGSMKVFVKKMDIRSNSTQKQAHGVRIVQNHIRIQQ